MVRLLNFILWKKWNEIFKQINDISDVVILLKKISTSIQKAKIWNFTNEDKIIYLYPLNKSDTKCQIKKEEIEGFSYHKCRKVTSILKKKKKETKKKKKEKERI